MQQLQMPQAIFDRMPVQANEAVPLEACGILAGQGHEVVSIDKVDDHSKGVIVFQGSQV